MRSLSIFVLSFGLFVFVAHAQDVIVDPDQPLSVAVWKGWALGSGEAVFRLEFKGYLKNTSDAYVRVTGGNIQVRDAETREFVGTMDIRRCGNFYSDGGLGGGIRVWTGTEDRFGDLVFDDCGIAPGGWILFEVSGEDLRAEPSPAVISRKREVFAQIRYEVAYRADTLENPRDALMRERVSAVIDSFVSAAWPAYTESFQVLHARIDSLAQEVDTLKADIDMSLLGDLDNDGIVGVSDFLIFVEQFGKSANEG